MIVWFKPKLLKQADTGEWRNWYTCLPAGRRANEMIYFVYAIKSQKKNYIYVGMSANVVRRVQQHNSGKSKTTKPYAPFDLIYTEIVGTRAKARIKEKYLKSGTGKEFLKTLL